MKFLCDRCKTRYSIGDDRVRGKILKIRCKNCANVITVREGMDAAADVGAGDRRNRPTTAAPLAQQTLPAARNGKPASSVKPPPALEEEWYVSVDGDQSGPFTLAEAQRWVAGKAWDADLHCWSEGFDDWLPVDKVSHFRGLRKKPLPAQKPPPLPRVGGRMGVAVQPQFEEEPKALFAATMAQLEKGVASEPISTMPAPSAVKASPAGTGAVARQPMPSSSSTPIAARTNGSAALKPINVPGSVPKLDSKPIEKRNDSKPVPKIVARPEPAILKPTAATPATPARGAKKPDLSAGAQALAAAFDASDSSETGLEGLTQVEAPAFNDEVSTTAEPVATKRVFDRFDSVEAKTTARPAPGGWAPPQPPVRTPSQELEAAKEGVPEDDNLEIGEVSRVVNLADLMKPTQRKSGRAPGLRATGAVQRMSPSELGLSPLAASGPLTTAGLVADGALETALPPPPVVANRRAMLMLVIVAAIVLGAATAVVVVMMQDSDDDDQVNYGRSTLVDTDRPDNPHRNPLDPTVGPGSNVQPKSHPTFRPPFTPNTPHPPTGSDEPPDPHGSLRGDEIEDVARLHQATTNRCYMRAQRGVDALTIGEVKRITVSLTIDRDGAVTAVNLSDHGSDSLGKCLISAIRGWRLRSSPGGNFQITLAFTDT